MALVSPRCCFSSLIASFVGRINSLIFAALGFAFHFLHDRQCAGAGADHQATALPRHHLFEREWGVSEGAAELSGWLLFALSHLAAVDPHVVFLTGSLLPD